MATPPVLTHLPHPPDPMVESYPFAHAAAVLTVWLFPLAFGALTVSFCRLNYHFFLWMILSVEDGVEHVLLALMLFIRTFFAGGWRSVPVKPACGAATSWIKGWLGTVPQKDALVSWEMQLGKIPSPKVGGPRTDNPKMKVCLQPPPEHLWSAPPLFRYGINFFLSFLFFFLTFLTCWSIFA